LARTPIGVRRIETWITMSNKSTHTGSCHCGRVAFELDAQLDMSSRAAARCAARSAHSGTARPTPTFASSPAKTSWRCTSSTRWRRGTMRASTAACIRSRVPGSTRA